ncbi:hypothetical protein I5L59_21180 [Pseudomonas moraviensis]|uniref:hypothetical protein n=1 Tax=Pseudomonas moraviensis TaxID=321662 RepID=UPI0018D7267E|nr:hypothetical protein [Pseudomonas moraviensis]MBH3446097.1 hypothetical protein [Pseudomonas moraviensis]
MSTLKVSSELWEPLSEIDRGKIAGILIATKIMAHDDKIVPDATTLQNSAPLALSLGFPGDLVKPVCQAACVAAGASAVAACAGLNPVAAAACYAIAAAAVEECKSHC